MSADLQPGGGRGQENQQLLLIKHSTTSIDAFGDITVTGDIKSGSRGKQTPKTLSFNLANNHSKTFCRLLFCLFLHY